VTRCLPCLALVVALASVGAACAGPAAVPAARAAAAARVDLLGEIDAAVRADFYDPALLERVGWTQAVTRARRELAGADRPARTRILRQLLALLRTSHTELYPRTDPAYWEIAGVYERILRDRCAGPGAPRFPITRDEVGVFWREIGARWFVIGLLPGGPAARAGLLVGDEVVSADGRALSPVLSFEGKADRTVLLQVRRRRGGPLLPLRVTPRRMATADLLQQATARSWKVIRRGQRRFGYLHVWSWSSPAIQQDVLGALARFNDERVDGVVLDIRDGWGGASPSYLGIFFQDPPVLESVDRAGKRTSYDQQIRRPAALLVNRGTRSGKELVAYGAKKHGLAALVGERTGGAVVFGGPRCLGDGSILYLAQLDAVVDGERLEGRGVAPDIEVPFDVRWAAGRDPQLERALDHLAAQAGVRPLPR
jgi:carboxyl-terminal processing protease